MKKEEIYLNLDECTRFERHEALSIIENQNIDAVYNIDYFPYDYNTLKFTSDEEWFVGSEFSTSNRTEVTFTQFKQLCSEWGYIDALPKQLTELEKECLQLLELIYSDGYKFDQWHEIDFLITKLKSHETI